LQSAIVRMSVESSLRAASVQPLAVYVTKIVRALTDVPTVTLIEAVSDEL